MKEEKTILVDKILFKAQDGYLLDGFLFLSQTNHKKVMLHIHGMSSNGLKEREEIIAREVNKLGIDFFSFNNRGSELARYLYRYQEGKKEKKITGCSYEDPKESYFDIIGAIEMLRKRGYTDIYLEGHSLGSTKIVYTYDRMLQESNPYLENVKVVMLRSLLDIAKIIKIYLNKNYEQIVQIAQNYINEGKPNTLMPDDVFIHPVCAKTFCIYTKYNREIDVAPYETDQSLPKLNQIKVPLFMLFGDQKNGEMIEQTSEELIDNLNHWIKNPQKEIQFIKGSDHNYWGKEQEMANKMKRFLENLL